MWIHQSKCTSNYEIYGSIFSLSQLLHYYIKKAWVNIHAIKNDTEIGRCNNLNGGHKREEE